MKRTLTLLALLLCGALQAQNVLLYENFDEVTTSATTYSGPLPDGWSCYKLDNESNHSQLNYFQEAWAVVNFSGYGKNACCVTKTASGNAVDRWLISPEVTLDSAYYVLDFEAGSGGSTTMPEIFTVYVSTTGSQPADFTEVLIPRTEFGIGSSDFHHFHASLEDYAGQSIRFAIRCQTADEYFFRIDEVKIFTPPTHEMALSSIALPRYIPTDSAASMACTVTNNGSATINSFKVTYTVNGGTPVEETVTGVSIPFRGSHTFLCSTPIIESQPGDYTVSVSISLPNGEPDSDPSDNTLTQSFQAYPADLATQRTMLIEQFTGNACGYCPAGADRIREALAGGSNYVWVTYHAGYTQDALSNAHGNAMTCFYNGSTYAPAFMIDRTNWGDNPGPVRSVPNVADIRSLFAQAQTIPTFATVAFENFIYDPATRHLSATVSGDLRYSSPSAQPRLMVLQIEDSIILAQADYYNGTQPQFRHLNTVRSSLTGTWGVPLSLDANGHYSHTIDWTMIEPSTIIGNHAVNVASQTHLVAFLYNYDSEDVNNCPVFNATRSPKLCAHTAAISQQPPLEIALYPNPATSLLHVATNGEYLQAIELLDMQGRTVLRHNGISADETTLNISHLPAGLYLLRAVAPSGTTLHKVSVAR